METLADTIRSYRFANKIWLDFYLSESGVLIRLSKILTFSITPWIVGFLISYYNQLEITYLQTGAFYIGSIGILLTLFGISYGSNAQYKIYIRLFSIFGYSDDKIRAEFKKILARHSTLTVQLGAPLFVLATSGTITALGFFAWPLVEPASAALGTTLPRFEIFERHGWYEAQNAAVGFFIVITYVLFLSFPLGTSAALLTKLPFLMHEISNAEPKLPPAIIKHHFSQAANFYTTVSTMWLLGCGLIYLFARSNNDLITYTFIVLIFLMGLANFLIPQIAYVRLCSRAEEALLRKISKIIRDKSENDDIIESTIDSDIMNMINRDDWVYPVHQTYAILLIYIVSAIEYTFGWKLIISSINSFLSA